MSGTNSHPDPRRLATFAAGQLDEQAMAAVERHLSECGPNGPCARLLDSLPEDRLDQELRERLPPVPPLPPARPKTVADSRTVAPQPVVRHRLIRSLARAIVKSGAKPLDGSCAGATMHDVTAAVWAECCQGRQPADLAAELQALAVAPREQIAQEARAVAQEVSGLPSKLRDALAAYLAQVPAAIRRDLRRPS